MTIPNFPDIYIVGDFALLNGKDGKPLPGVAQVAMQTGAYAARAITSKVAGKPPLAPFSYFNKGDMAVIGRFAAVANIFGVHVSGFLAWLVWLFIHLMYIVEFQSRILVFIEWGFLYLTFNRGARLITGNRRQQIHRHSPCRWRIWASNRVLELLISGPDGPPARVELRKTPLTLGRSVDNDLAYPHDPWLSRYHLCFEQRERTWWIRDCESRNGTILNSTGIKAARSRSSPATKYSPAI